MLLACTRCNGQVIERDGLDGAEKICLNCGFGQIPNIIPNEVLANDSEDFQRRNRSAGWSDTYYDLSSRYGTRYAAAKKLGHVGKKQYFRSTNRLETPRKKQQYEQAKRRQKVTIEDIKTWSF